MDKALRQKAYSLVKLLADSCQQTFVPTKYERELLEILADNFIGTTATTFINPPLKI